MNTKFITTITDLENSKWVKMVKNAEVMNNLLPMAESWLNQHKKLRELAHKVKTAVSLLSNVRRDELFTRRNLLLAGCILYTVSPLDIIPDVTPILGFMDDLALITMTLNSVLSPLCNNSSNKDLCINE